MDRHEFVQMLIAKRNDANKALVEAQERRRVAYKRSATRFAGMLEAAKNPPDSNEYRLFIDKLEAAAGLSAVTLPEELFIDDESIIKLCVEIHEIREKTKDTLREVAKYENQDFVKEIEQLL